MELKQYLEESKRTFNHENEYKDTEHALKGVVTEWFELKRAIRRNDYENRKEEAGDIMFYLAQLIRQYNLEINIGRTENVNAMGGYYIIGDSLVEDLVDLFKRHFHYGVQLDISFLTHLVSSIVDMLNSMNTLISKPLANYKGVMEINIAKLKVRYPDKFSPEKAINRDLEKEKEVLNG